MSGRPHLGFVEVVLDNKDHPVYSPLQAGSIDGTDVVPHDHAIARAMKATYSPHRDSKLSGNPYRTLFVARLSPATTESTLRAFFERWGPLVHLRLVRDVVTGCSKCYAFVTYEQEPDFRRAWRDSHRMELDGCHILVEYERERVCSGWVPRRLGAGIGGRKESGQLRFGGRDRPFRRPLDSSQALTRSLKPQEPEQYSKVGVIMHTVSAAGISATCHVKAEASSFRVTKLS